MNTTTLRTQDNIHYLTAELNDDVNATRDEAFAWQEWDVLPDPFGDPSVRLLRSCHGKYLSAYSPEYCAELGLPPNTVRASAQYADVWERWRCAKDGVYMRFQSVAWGLWLSPQNVPPSPLAGGGEVLCNGPEPSGWETFLPSNMAAFGNVAPPQQGVRKIEGQASVYGRSFGDRNGPCLFHGCSDFVAMAKANEDFDNYQQNLDTTALYQKYTRIGWRCNGWRPWVERGLTVDPYRHPWWESALRKVLGAHRDRGVKVSISSFDMNNWTDQQCEDAFRRTAQICAEYGDTVIFSAITNEMAGTWDPGETPEHIARARELMAMWVSIYPGGLQALSDPQDRSKEGMRKLAWTMAMTHQWGRPIDTGLRRCFNDMFENYPGFPIDQNEPRGPNGPGGGDVTEPIEQPDEIFALYTMHVLTGQASTYFNGPGAATRAPLDSTWGFKELPKLWRDLEIPEDIGQGMLCAGHRRTFMDVHGSHASRADGVRHGAYGLGEISGVEDGHPWAVRACLDATWSTWYADGKAWEGRLAAGAVIPTPRGFTPAVIRSIQ